MYNGCDHGKEAGGAPTPAATSTPDTKPATAAQTDAAKAAETPAQK